MKPLITPPLYRTIGEVVADQAVRRGDRTAVVFGARCTSFSELNRQATKIADGLLHLQCGAGTHVGVLARNSDRYVALIFGAAKAGALLLVMNWRLVRPELEFVASDARIRVLFFDAEFVEEARNLKSRDPDLVLVTLGDEKSGEITFDEFLEQPPSSGCAIDAKSPVLLLYTSGTTGNPKGVILSHFGLLHNLTLPYIVDPPFPVRDDDVVLLSPPLFHIGGVNILLGAMIGGAKTVVLTDARVPAMVAAIGEHKVTRAVIVPVLMPKFIEAAEAGARLDSLKTILYGMSAIPETVLTSMLEHWSCSFIQNYGLTETSGGVTCLGHGDHYPGSARLRSCGRAMPDIDIMIRRDDGTDAAPGEAGEVLVRSPSLLVGLWQGGKPTPAPLVDGWYATGDIGYLDPSGYLFLCDRKKDMIVSGGENIYSNEVEAVICQHPDVERVAVIGVPSEKWGEEAKAIIIPRAGSTPDAHSITAFARARLAGYKVPKSVEFVTDLPVTSIGKIAKNVLRERYWQGKSRLIN